MANNLQHPARQEQGLGAPAAPQSSGAEYFTRNGSLAAKEAQMSGEQAARENAIAKQAAQQGLQAGQVQAANAMTNKLLTEKAMLESFGQQAPQGLAPQQGVDPRSIQAEQATDALLSGQTSVEGLIAAAEQGQLDMGAATQAIQNFRNMEAQTANQYNQAQGLGL